MSVLTGADEFASTTRVPVYVLSKRVAGGGAVIVCKQLAKHAPMAGHDLPGQDGHGLAGL